MTETVQDVKQPVPLCGMCGRRLRWPGWEAFAECECGMQTKWSRSGRKVTRVVPAVAGDTLQDGEVDAERASTPECDPSTVEPARRGRNRAGVTVVCGPAGSGKTTWVAQHAEPGDLIVDLDTVYEALSGLSMYEKPQALLPFVLAARDAVYQRLLYPNSVRHAWIITADGQVKTRANLHKGLGARVIVLAVPAQICLQRIATDPRRTESVQVWAQRVHKWYQQYRPAGFDVLITPAELQETRQGG